LVALITTDLKPFRGIIVEKMLEYMAFRAHYENVGPREEIPVNEIMERLTPEVVLEL
jgi:transcription elongation factor B subunit 1